MPLRSGLSDGARKTGPDSESRLRPGEGAYDAATLPGRVPDARLGQAVAVESAANLDGQFWGQGARFLNTATITSSFANRTLGLQVRYKLIDVRSILGDIHP